MFQLYILDSVITEILLLTPVSSLNMNRESNEQILMEDLPHEHTSSSVT